MDYENKYNKALETARKEYKTHELFNGFRVMLLKIFPELEQSADEDIRKALIEYYSFDEDGHSHVLDNITPEQIIDWLKKQGEIDKIHYDIAEKEKCEFVSDGFIKCYANFQDFKEGETYSLEYLGNDNYNVSSVNLLGKIYHITPCQLYTVFKKQTWLEKQGEQKLIDKVESKFEVGDWITFFGGGAFKILKVESELNGTLDYLLLDQNGHDSYYNKKYVDENARLWTIQDAKAGDVLVCPKYAGDILSNIFIFKDIKRKDNDVYCYCSFLKTFTTEGYVASADPIDTDFCPATKEQHDILFTKMKEEGYGWDNEKKELITLNQFVDNNDNCNNDKPNLKIGDWVIREDGRSFHNGNKFAKITKIDGTMCFLDTGKWISNVEIRAWSIYDAEPGDMLCWDNSNCVAMFRNIIDSESFASYGYVGSLSNRFSQESCFHEIKGVHPASTERCIRLHKAMTEEGYAWDNKKKELIVSKIIK